MFVVKANRKLWHAIRRFKAFLAPRLPYVWPSITITTTIATMPRAKSCPWTEEMVPDMDDFLVRAVLAGLGVAAVAAPLGVFVVWRRMAYFGDTMAHSALLGITLGVLLGVNLDFGVFVVCVATALLLVGLQRRRQLADDTLLGILSHGTLSLGVIAVTFLDSLRLDLISYLFGDILAVSTTDLAWIYGGGALVLIVLAVIWRPLLASVVHEELARVEGVPVTAVRLVFMILMAAVIAVIFSSTAASAIRALAKTLV